MPVQSHKTTSCKIKNTLSMYGESFYGCHVTHRQLVRTPKYSWTSIKWTAISEFGLYRLCEQRRFRRACASAARSYKQWVKRNLQSESQIPGPSEWLGMRSKKLSWRNARRHKFAWRGPNVFKNDSFTVMLVNYGALVIQTAAVLPRD